VTRYSPLPKYNDVVVKADWLRGKKKFTTPERRVARAPIATRVRLKIVLADSEKQDHHRKIRQLTGG
jgi:hypothetical protein